MNAIDREKLLEWTRANLCPLCERVIGIGLEYGALDIKPPDIHWSYSGADEMYHVFVNGQKVHSAKTEYERDMFIAELKAKTGG